MIDVLGPLAPNSIKFKSHLNPEINVREKCVAPMPLNSKSHNNCHLKLSGQNWSINFNYVIKEPV